MGPLLFQVGLLTLLIRFALRQPGRIFLAGPASVFLGFLLIAANLDLLPVGAILIVAGLTPLAIASPSHRAPVAAR